MTFKPVRTIAQAKQWLFLDLPAAPRQVFRGAAGLERGRYLMQQLGNPQDSYKSIHIAGTSGKGSTAYIISKLLQSRGKTVGLHVSPHIYDFRERMQVNGRLISWTELCRHINNIRPIAEAMSWTEYGSPTYFEVALALAHLVFRERQVDYGVIETGLGGLYDVSNLISRPDKLSVITQIGLDHMDILGKTICEIAAQKAGIILPGSHAIALWQKEAARSSFEVRAKAVGAELEYVDPSKNTRKHFSNINGSEFDLILGSWNWPSLKLKLVGRHQVANALLALRAIQFLDERDNLNLTAAAARRVMSRISIPARFEAFKVDSKTVIIDAAHNPQKLSALVETTKQVFPGQKVIFILAMTYHKNCADLLKPLLPIAESIILTSFTTDSAHKLESPQRVSIELDKLGFHNYEIEPDIAQATYRARQLEPNVIIVTGSVYFLGQIKDSLKLPLIATERL